MIITLHWADFNQNVYIYVSRDIVEVSRNPQANEPSELEINIPNNAKGKQFWFWIMIRNHDIYINVSGRSSPAYVSHILHNTKNELSKIYVSDSPFTIKRALITKNLYAGNTNAFKDVREYERNERTII